MNFKPVRNLVASVGLGCLAPALASAQPVITAEPASQFLAAGATANFSVSATGTAPLAYQWLFDGAVVLNATGATLSLTNPQPAQWGYYSVLVSNASGSVTSQVAELKTFEALPHSFSGIQAESNGLFSLRFAGGPSAALAPYYDMYPLETSSNLVDWSPLATLQATNSALGPLSFLDTNSADFSLRFYRTATNQLATPDLPPTGPYAVGTFSVLLTNTLRGNAEFMATFWYPAQTRSGALPAKYVEPPVAMYTLYYNLLNYGFGAGDFAPEVEQFFSHSQSNAPPLTNSGPFPVILYQPGAGGHRRENTDKTEELASWGYVVVGLDTADTEVSVYPDGSYVVAQYTGSTIEATDAAIEGRFLDLQFVLNEVASMQTNGSPLDGILDVNNIGAFGWSLGGATAAQLCLLDPRCKAGAAFDGAFFETNLLTETMKVPFLYFRSDDGPDPGNEVFLPDGRPEDALEVWNHFKTNAYWVKLDSTVHGNFADPGLIDDSATLLAFWGSPMSLQFLPTARFSQIVRAYLLSFFNKFLKGADDHLLDGRSASYPEVLQFLTASTNQPVLPPAYPCAALVQGTNGNFYGSTAFGGIGGNGAIFEVAANGAMSVLVSFNGTNGSHPWGALALGADGNFYGTTKNGGVNGDNGTVFQMTPAGALTTLFSFNGANGSYPAAGLVEGPDGRFYGTTAYGGINGNSGTVFAITSAGNLTTLVSFNGTNAGNPYAGLALAANGNFYGTTVGGGASGNGTVFRVTSVGPLTVSLNGTNGEAPAAGLVQGANGDFYGATTYGGSTTIARLNAGYGFGTLFKLTSGGVLTTLVVFDGAQGGFCVGGLARGADGNFYGTTEGGGAGGGGTVFQMTPAGALTTLAAFSGPDGYGPAAGLIQGRDGNFYGTTEYGGANGLGTVFQVTTNGALATLVSFGAP